VQVRRHSQWHEPQPPQRIDLDDTGSFIVVEDEMDRVMPSKTSVITGTALVPGFQGVRLKSFAEE
jgi:hypothetical protein